MEQRRAVDRHNGGVEVQNGAVNQWSKIRITLMRRRTWIRHKVKRGIRTRITVMLIRIHGYGTTRIFELYKEGELSFTQESSDANPDP
jgi:hypothetical protein